MHPDFVNDVTQIIVSLLLTPGQIRLTSFMNGLLPDFEQDLQSFLLIAWLDNMTFRKHIPVKNKNDIPVKNKND